ncbi:hypothetical protein BaRGS_00014928 [Batillaria attramentaria]|uniref:C2H2-type domain-containing protein n=1 Tax=Batillaria attramentaria TaxID=370345 RepID=A0ABD0L2Z4_9CAEN
MASWESVTGLICKKTLARCCVCCKILSHQCDRDSISTPNCLQRIACGDLCFKVLDQTLAFVQGFVLCKLICVLLDQHTNSRQRENTELSHSKFSDSSSSHSRLPPANKFGLPRKLSVTAETSVETSIQSRTQTPRGPGKLMSKFRKGSLRSAARITARKPSHCVEVKPTAKEETRTLAYYNKAEVCRFLVEDVAGHSACDISLCNSVISSDQDVAGRISGIASHNNTNQLDKGRILCSECGMEFRTRKSAHTHLIKKHRKPDINKQIACRICGKLYGGKASLTLHIKSQHAEEKAVECDICGERFSGCRAHYRHMKIVHNIMHGVCHICGKHFKYPNALKEHMKAHAGIRGLVCELCGKSFVRISALCTHRKLSHGHGKQTKGSDQDQSHKVKEKWPQKPRPKLDKLQCRECKTTLADIKTWRTHMEEHKLSRTIFCEICGKGVKTQSSLQKHKQQHQAKRFQCDVCSKPFTYKCNMQKHKETHNEDRPFVCEFCQKAFKSENAVNRHKALHIEDRQFKCHICGKGYTRGNNLERHVQTMHPRSDT